MYNRNLGIGGSQNAYLHEIGYDQPVGASPIQPKPVRRLVVNSARDAVRITVKHSSSKYAGCVIEP